MAVKIKVNGRTFDLGGLGTRLDKRTVARLSRLWRLLLAMAVARRTKEAEARDLLIPKQRALTATRTAGMKHLTQGEAIIARSGRRG